MTSHHPLPAPAPATFPLRLFLAVLLLFSGTVAVAADGIDLEPYLRRNGFGSLALSPDGAHYAATVAQQDSTVLVVVRRSDKKTVSGFSMGRNVHVKSFDWVDNERLLVSVAEKFGVLETPLSTGELFLVDTKGTRAKALIGYRAGAAGDMGESASTAQYTKLVRANLLDRLRAEPDHVLVEVWPYDVLPESRVQRMNLRTGAVTMVADSPVPRSHFATDNAGHVRFAVGAGADNISKLYHRSGDEADWQLVNDEAKTRIREFPIGFSADNQVAYLEVEHASGPNAIISWDTRTGERKPLLRDASLDPWDVLRAPGADAVPIGALYNGGGVRAAFFDEAAPASVLYRKLQKGFGGDPVRIVSTTDDGKLALVENWSAHNPGDFFLFDIGAGKAERVLSRRDWILPSASAEVVPVSLKARDGLALDGLLTRARGSQGPLPLVVMPHGGPFGISDDWAYDDDAQLLAQAGYAVLQLNYRGSGGRGRKFMEAGAKQWGLAMQDDLTDATRWAIEQGHAEAGKVCLVGGSYGAYAAMLGLAREPALYKCGVGYVGVYDLERMAKEDARDGRSSATWVADWLGEPAALREVSATTLAGRIKAPVLLVAGGRDLIAPIVHSRDMKKALEQAGTPVETLFVGSEGHGFYDEENRREYYETLLDFLATHLGGRRAK